MATAIPDLQLAYVTGEDGARHLTVPDDVMTFVRTYIRETAARPAADIAAAVQEGHDELRRAFDDVSEAQARFKPGPDDWSILELLDHVVTVKRAMALLATSLSKGAWPPGFSVASEREDFQDGVTFVRFDALAEARAAVDAAHGELMAFIATITDDTSTEKEFRHFLFGSMNCRQWAAFQRIHDADHAPGIGKIKAAPGYPRA
jgi:hypothetical protein